MHFFALKNNEIIIFDFFTNLKKLDSEKLNLVKIVPGWYLDLSQTGCYDYETKNKNKILNTKDCN